MEQMGTNGNKILFFKLIIFLVKDRKWQNKQCKLIPNDKVKFP